MARSCATCGHYRGAGKQCEPDDWVTATRALRWPDDGQFCPHHEREAPDDRRV